MIKKKTYTFNGNGVTTCKCCEKGLGKKPPYYEACSANCANALAELRATPLPVPFVISLINRTKDIFEREMQLKQYIARHNLDEQKVFSKFNDIVNTIKTCGLSSVKRKPLVLI